MSNARGLRDGLKSYVPRWLSNRAGLNAGFKVLFAIAIVCDAMIQIALDGLRAAWPGRGSPDALPLVAQSRGLLQGEAETNDAFAGRLRGWLTTWLNAAATRVLAQEIQAYLGNTPTVRIVSRAGLWVTVAPDGTVTTLQPGAAAWSWDWDSTSNPERNAVGAPWWSDIWIIVTPCEWPITGTALTSLVGKWGTYNGVGTGHAVPRAAVDAIRQLVATWKGAHTWLEAIIWSYDATLFDPTLVNAGNPDGTWGYWTKISTGTRVPARTGASTGTVRYWIPAKGGG